MKIKRMKVTASRLTLLLCLLAVASFTGCEGDKPRNNTAKPSAAAQAPSITQPVVQQAPSPVAEQPVQQTARPVQRPQQDPIDQLVAQVEQAYKAGQQEYSAGHLAAAKTNFDRAVNLLLTGPVEVRSDDRLQREFDKIVEGINQLEMAAMKEGDGFTEQKTVPAPIDELNEIAFPADPAVTARAQATLKNIKSDLPLMINDTVAGYINYFSTRGRNTLINAWRRGGKYHDMIIRILREEGVPTDLFYQAEAESGFYPTAVSKAAARGMWQFMASRATGYGLERNWWVDERQDPEKSTRAAARHLKDLYNQFGDWYLAIAAYDCGPGNIQRGVQRTGYADFWELYKRNVLPQETRNYVPIILAMAIIGKDPAAYGITDIQTEPPLQYDVVTTDYAADLRLVAEAVDAPAELLAELNPALIRRTTPKNVSYDLKLPVGTKGQYLAAIEVVPVDKRVLWRYHHVAEGETLAGIARKYKTTSSAIAEANALDEGKPLTADAKLVIPVTGKTTGTGVGTYSRKATRYKVRKGDTVLSVADDFGVPADKLRQWNKLKGNALARGRTLSIYKPVDATSAETKPAASASSGSRHGARSASAGDSGADAADDPPAARKASAHYEVEEGDTLGSIARKFHTTVEKLQKLNGMSSTRLKIGQKLRVR